MELVYFRLNQYYEWYIEVFAKSIYCSTCSRVTGTVPGLKSLQFKPLYGAVTFMGKHVAHHQVHDLYVLSQKYKEVAFIQRHKTLWFVFL